MKGKYVSAEEFVRGWQTAESISDAAKTLGLTYQTVANRATKYRQKGVRLKKYYGAIDVDALNVICDATVEKDQSQ